MEPTWDFNADNATNSISHWIMQYVKQARAKGVVIGLSGGADSATVAGLSVRALGKENVLGVILPCESHPQDKNDALAVVDWLGIDHRIVDLAFPFEQFVLQAEHADATLIEAATLTKANIKARLRMVALYVFANHLNYLNMGTGNKSELMIGYITKYGDGGVDFEPLGEYYKGEVYAMARVLGVPQQIIDRKPSAGLWEGQTDEDEIGMPYGLLDELLQVPESIRQVGGDNPDIALVNKLIAKSEHKRNMPPTCPRG
jgi:NAD+ synthase